MVADLSSNWQSAYQALTWFLEEMIACNNHCFFLCVSRPCIVLFLCQEETQLVLNSSNLFFYAFCWLGEEMDNPSLSHKMRIVEICSIRWWNLGTLLVLTIKMSLKKLVFLWAQFSWFSLEFTSLSLIHPFPFK